MSPLTDARSPGTAVKNVKEKQKASPIQSGDVVVSIQGRAVGSLLFKDAAKLIQDAKPPIVIVFSSVKKH